MIPAVTRYRAPPAGSGIQVVSSSNGGSQTSSATIPAPSGIVAGNLLYALFTCDDTKSPLSLACAGWTLHTSLIFTTHNDNGFIGGFYKIATASEPASYTFSGATVKSVNIGILNLSGVNQSDPINSVVPVTKKATAATSCVFPAITLPKALYLLLIAGQGGSFSGSVSNVFTPPAGYTMGVSSTSQYNQGSNYDAESSFGALSNAAVAAGAQTPAPGTFNVSYAYGAINVALNPA
ncbi:hypothetical protein [Paraburkholderia sp. C35]|uniref:hypothetical protein n=1 Tax=Paraburkholderia sp. C35 TaxID=2126993 RepID=UPI000D6981FC|nr:hypothetical protein [Paraburkholderia sp. C35]